MIVLKINQNVFVVKEDISVLEACKFVGVKIPRFCYHETLSTAGNCRMCLVKLEVDDKLIVSCLTPVESDMDILSNDPVIQKAREEVLEFLLLDHPLDCPICDQGGECDLQDQAKNFGSNISKYQYDKMAVEDKNFGVFIKSIMTRCIHCTRCVRFSAEVAGVDFFGTLNRGNNTEVGTYSLNFFDSEISGNVVDLCPVGALTSKPYAFKSRPWELRSSEAIDLSDGVGSNIYVNFSESGVSRIIPKFNSEVNETIITDKARFSYDSFTSSTSLSSIISFSNYKNNDQLDFLEVFKKIKTEINDKNVLVLVSDDLSMEELNILKKISFINSRVKIRSISLNGSLYNSNSFFNFSNEIKKIKKASDTIFLLSINPRTEAALINTRLRFLSYNNYFNIYSLGLKFNSILKNAFLNINVADILKLIEGKSQKLSKAIVNTVNPLFICGDGLKSRGFNVNIIETFLKKTNPSLISLLISNKSNTLGSKYLNIKSLSSSDLKQSEVLFFIKCRETVFLKNFVVNPNVSKKIYWLNTHCFKHKIRFGYQIPIKNFFEEVGTYFNLEFRPQKFKKIFSSKVDSRSSFFIFKYLFDIKNPQSRFNSFIKSFTSNPELYSQNSKNTYLSLLKKFQSKISHSFVKKYPFKPQIIDFFRTNYYTDCSKNMLVASREFQKRDTNFF